MIGLEWAQALEQPNDASTTPAGARRAWLHKAPERHVLELYRRAAAAEPDLPAPWWLRALAAGSIRSRRDAFLIEDRVAKLLDSRPGWVFVPWGADGETGYWEYMPSERLLDGPGIPTTLQFTDRHLGWLDLVPPHAGYTPPRAVVVNGPADLRANLSMFESLAP
ncbi:hypothetical protein [Herbihabitans rhizosphaerae]|nr:hypothetical protein [Herbihabitans rhizosphaerae]